MSRTVLRPTDPAPPLVSGERFGLQKWFAPAYRPYWVLLGLALVVRLATALLFHQPGYTDGYYYSNVAELLWRGQGFTENYVWNYMGRPLPAAVTGNPSSLYWMPLTSILIYLAYLVGGGPSFLASQMPGVLFSALLAPLSFYLAVSVFGNTAQGRRYGWLAGTLTIFSGIFAAYFVLPDNFAPFALFSCGFLVCAGQGWQRLLAGSPGVYRRAALAGTLAGLAYLTRVDGLLLLAVPVVCSLFNFSGLKKNWPVAWRAWLVMLGLFAVVITPWLLRNLATTGQLLPGGGVKVLFWREYNDFYSYAKPLDLPYYLNLTQPSPYWSLGQLLGSKLDALWENLLIVARGALFLTPFFVIGLVSRDDLSQPSPPAPARPASARLWHRPELGPFLVYTVLLYLAMSLAFTFAGTRGSLFHSSGGLLPYLFLVSLAGLDRVISWLGKLSRPGATANRQRRYGLLVIVSFVCLTLILTLGLPGDWDKDYNEVRQVGVWLDTHETPGTVVMMPLGPAFWYVTHHSSIATSSDNLATNYELARRYGAKYLVLFPDHYPDTFYEVYGTKKGPDLVFVTEFDGVQIYRLPT